MIVREKRERKRKGKAIAAPVKKKPRQPSTTLVIQEGRHRIEEDECEEDEALRFERRSKMRNDGARSTSEQRPEMARVKFGKTHVRLDNELLGQMIIFDDPKMTVECGNRVGAQKKARSGKQPHQPSLHALRGEVEFLEYITEGTTDPGEESISFRMFTREVRMSIQEWSVRLGLDTADQEVEWFGTDIGNPKDISAFNQQAAWKEIVPENTADFQLTLSIVDCIKYLILRLAQVFLGYNPLGQANTANTVTEAEIYFMWCMREQRKVHLGHWISRTCHAIAIRASRHLNTCHILGALFRNCVEMSIERRIPRMTYCPNSELFDTKFFTNVGILVRRSGRLGFYKVTQQMLQLAKVAEVENENLSKEEETPTEPATSATHAELVELVEHLDELRAMMERLL